MSTISITNGESSTVFYKVEYSLDSGSTFTVLSTNLSVTASSTDTSLTVNVSHGGTVLWRITDSFTSGDFTNMSVETQTESSAVDCDPDSTFSISFASCVSDAKISTLAITNGESSTVFYKVEYSLDSGTTFTVLSANLSVAASTSDSSSTTSVSEGGTIIWRITDSFTTGDFTNMSLEAQADLQ